MIPIGRHVIVTLLPEAPASTILYTEGLAPEKLTRRAVVKAVGSLCRHTVPQSVVIVRSNLGTQIGSDLLLPESACLATVTE